MCFLFTHKSKLVRNFQPYPENPVVSLRHAFTLRKRFSWSGIPKGMTIFKVLFITFLNWACEKYLFPWWLTNHHRKNWIATGKTGSIICVLFEHKSELIGNLQPYPVFPVVSLRFHSGLTYKRLAAIRLVDLYCFMPTVIRTRSGIVMNKPWPHEQAKQPPEK